MINILRGYRNLERPVVHLILAEFFIQMINVVFFLVLNLYMAKHHYSDANIANFISYRFLAVMLLSLPLGFLIKGRKLKPFFYLASVIVPAASLGVVFAVEHNFDFLIFICLSVWGVAYTCMKVSLLPYILRNTSSERHSEAIALTYTTWSVSMIISGLMIFLFQKIAPAAFDERKVLLFFSALGFVALYFVFKSGAGERVPRQQENSFNMGNYDWLLIVKALLPTFILAVGAGLTIPFINLFFYHIFGVDSHQFSLMGACTAVLVAFASIIVPHIKKTKGYGSAVTLTQSIAVGALILLATTQYYSHLSFALYLAVFCFAIRQPLMSMAAPITSELAMYYVGNRNQEMTSALTASIWAGSWFISSQIFSFLRARNIEYANIFFITAALYAVGVLSYHFLIKDFRKRESKGLVEASL